MKEKKKNMREKGERKSNCCAFPTAMFPSRRDSAHIIPTFDIALDGSLNL